METEYTKNRTIPLRKDEIDLTNKLKQVAGVTQVAIYRRGLRAYQEEFIDRLSQNNVS